MKRFVGGSMTGFLCGLLLVSNAGATSGHLTGAGHSPLPVAVPSHAVAAVAVAMPSPQPSVSLTPLQINQLSKEFQQALASEKLALEHRQKFELKELKASQDARLKEWKEKEKRELKQLRDENRKPPEIRAYVKDRNARYSAFQAMLKEERKQRTQGQQVRMQSLKNDQELRRKEFEIFLKRGEVPPNRLWPQPGQ